MKILRLLPLVFLIFSCTHNSNQKTNCVNVDAEILPTLVNDHFGGVGFNVFDHMHNASRWHYEQIFAKRWRELNPSFARVPDACS
jgi:hypothetical protein